MDISFYTKMQYRSARTLSRLILFPGPTSVKYWSLVSINFNDSGLWVSHLSNYKTQGYEVVQGSQIERGASSRSITEPTRNVLFSTRQSAKASNDRLPDAVQQAKERLHQRLRSVDLFPGRRCASAFSSQHWFILSTDLCTLIFPVLH